jgi:transcriptional regulator with XRE-family HTH domain
MEATYRTVVITFVKDCRARSGKSQAAFADLIGVHKQTVTDYESGKTIPAVEKLELMARAAQLRFEDCLQVRAMTTKEREEERALKLFQQLNPRARRDVLATMQNLAELQRFRRESE